MMGRFTWAALLISISAVTLMQADTWRQARETNHFIRELRDVVVKGAAE